jgi:chromosome segregation ATPase
MRTPSRVHQVVLGFITGLLLLQQTAMAQFGGPVTVVADTSPTTISIASATNRSFLEELAHNIDEASQWIEQQNQRFAEIKHWESELTNLTGILSQAEDLVANKDEIIKSMSELAKIRRGVWQLYDQASGMVRRRIVSLKNIDDRVRQGIFNMDANLSDLEEYIRTGLGSGSEQKMNNLERMATLDVELQRWYEELQTCLYKKMLAVKQQKQDREAVEAETAKPEKERSQQTIGDASQELAQLETYIEGLDKRISELTSLIEERCKRYNMKMKDMSDFARQVEANQKAWQDYLNVNQKAIEELDNYAKTPSRRPQGQ